MAEAFTPKFVDLVRNNTTTQGTGNFVLGTAVSGFTGFAAAVVPGESFYYSAIGVDKPAEREVGRGTMQSNGTISRAPISGTKTNFTSGTKTISLIAAAEWFNQIQAGLSSAPTSGGAMQLSNAAVPIASRAELAALDRTKGMIAHLTEAGCEGLFVFNGANLSSAVADDAKQGLHVAPASAPTGSAGAWVRRLTDGTIRPEWFGAKGDGVVDDTLALAALARIVNARGGGVIELRPGATYLVGQQSFFSSPIGGVYNWYPSNHADFTGTGDNAVGILKFHNCSKPVIVRGNGATIRSAAGLKFGTFSNDGTAMASNAGYTGPGAAIPFYAAIYARSCPGGVFVENLELDGNLPELSIGGPFSDTGIQLPFSGLNFIDTPFSLCRVDAHHFGLDGLHVDGEAADDCAAAQLGGAQDCRFEFNGRNGMSIVGGKGMTFSRCAFSNQGMSSRTGTTTGGVRSNPCSGVDLEAEGGKAIRDVTFNDCEFVNNCNLGIVADSGTDVDRTVFNNCTAIGTINYALWLNRPGFRWNGGRIMGTVVNSWGGTAGGVEPHDAVIYRGVEFTTDTGLSPTGTVFQVNHLFLEATGAHVRFEGCHFDYTGTGNSSQSGAEIHFRDCSFHARGSGGALTMYGTYSGRTVFRESNGGAVNLPGNFVAGRLNIGPARDPWQYVDGSGAIAMHPATVDAAGNSTVTDYIAFDADRTLFAGTDPAKVILGAPITAERNWTLGSSGAAAGHKFRIVRDAAATGDFNLNIKNANGATLKALTAGTWAEFEVTGGAYGWMLTAAGSL